MDPSPLVPYSDRLTTRPGRSQLAIIINLEQIIQVLVTFIFVTDLKLGKYVLYLLSHDQTHFYLLLI